MVITIDGPMGSGKSTVGKELAKQLNYQYIDSDALYQVVAYYALLRNINLEDESVLSGLFRNLDIEEKYENGEFKIFNNHEDISKLIQTPEVNNIVSIVSSKPAIRYHLTALLHVWGAGESIVISGRDAGIYVFPFADFKFYLETSTRMRAERRFDKLHDNSFQGTVNDMEKNIIQKDQLDLAQGLVPLKPAKDAIIIDTNNKTIHEIIDIIKREIHKIKI